MMATGESESQKLIDAAFDMVTESRWGRLALADVAERAGVELAQAFTLFPSKMNLLVAMLTSTDQAMLAGGPADPGESPRDRVFDVLMRRFDALQARRGAIVAILRELPSDPVSALGLLPGFVRSLTWSLEAAGVPASGVLGLIRTQGLALVFLNGLRVWMNDETPDMAHTMVAVDKALKEIDGYVRRCPILARHGGDGRGPSTPSGSATEESGIRPQV
jgi:AcrR family transcriptional regulator